MRRVDLAQGLQKKKNVWKESELLHQELQRTQHRLDMPLNFYHQTAQHTLVFHNTHYRHTNYSTVYTAQYKVYMGKKTLDSAKYTLNSVHSAQYTVHTIQLTMYTVH